MGVGYLTLERVFADPVAGEAQRLRLAALLGSGLTGVLYVLDEPTIGLHPRDTQRLINVLRRLRDLGNTVLVVEHDLEMIRAADYVWISARARASTAGRSWPPARRAEVAAMPESITGAYLSGRLSRAAARAAPHGRTARR